MNITNFFQTFSESDSFVVLKARTKYQYSQYFKRLGALSENTLVFSLLSEKDTSIPYERNGRTGILSTPEEKIIFENSVWFETLGRIGSSCAKRMAYSVLKTVFNWGKSNGLLFPSSMQNLRSPKTNGSDKSYFNKEEMRKIYELSKSDVCPGSYKPYLDSAYFAFLTGMRPSEVESIRWKNIKDGFIEIFSAKHREEGKLSRLCRISQEIQNFLVDKTKREPEELVFSSKTGLKMNKDIRSKAIHFACSHLGIEHRDFYSTRRGTATEMFKAGYDIAKIAGQLGHKDIKTTSIYIKPNMREVAEAFKGF